MEPDRNSGSPSRQSQACAWRSTRWRTLRGWRSISRGSQRATRRRSLRALAKVRKDQLGVEIAVSGVDSTDEHRVRDAHMMTHARDAVAVDFNVGWHASQAPIILRSDLIESSGAPLAKRSTFWMARISGSWQPVAHSLGLSSYSPQKAGELFRYRADVLRKLAVPNNRDFPAQIL